MKRALAVSIVLLVATPASADTSIWEAAKAPKQVVYDDVHKRAAVLIERARYSGKISNPIGGANAFSALKGARDLLEQNGAATSPDPRLRFDLGLVLSRLLDYAGAAKVLEGAVALAPKHPLAEEGWFELALCYAHLGRHADEERAYLAAIPLTERATALAVIWSNLAESRMAQGKLAEAIDAAETSIDLFSDNPAPYWNLAILRDRQGDAWGAVESARHAIEYDPDRDFLDGEDVFFEPPYERHWYHALAELAEAERTSGDERHDHLLGALMGYTKWLDDAPKTDRFRPLAERNVARIEKMLKLKPSAKP